MASERVQKILAQAGITSRRKAEELIEEGSVTINGKVAKLGDKADIKEDSIKVNGKLLLSKEPPVYMAFYKPKNVISMMADPEGRPTIAGYLSKVKSRVFPVGRLDFTSEGLIFLTNDGAFAEKLQRADNLARVYHVKVRGRPDAQMVAKLEKGMRVGNRMVKPHSVRLAEEMANKIRIEVVFTDPGAIDVKSLFEMKGFLIESIRRTAIGHITLRGLEPGHYRLLKASQVEALLEQKELGFRKLAEDQDEEAPLPGTGFNYRFSKTKKQWQNDRDAEREATGSARVVIGGRTETGVRITPRGESDERKPRGAKPAGRGFGRDRDDRGSERSDRAPRGGKSFGRDRDRDDRGFGGERSDRAPRGGKSFGRGRDRDDRGFGGDRDGGYKPRGGKSFGSKGGFSGESRGPRFDSDRGPAPRGPKKSFGRDRDDRGFGGSSRGDRDSGFKPRGGKSFGRYEDRAPRSGDDRPRGGSFGANKGRGPRSSEGGASGGKRRVTSRIRVRPAGSRGED